MKSVIITLVVLGCCCCFVSAQSDKLQSGDSVRIALERDAVAKELIQLRDSMSISLLALDKKISKTSPAKGKKLLAARKELVGYQDQIELDLEEVTATSQKSWNRSAADRIKLFATTTRQEYKRIRLLL